MEKLRISRSEGKLNVAGIFLHGIAFITTLLFGFIARNEYLAPFGIGLVLALWLAPRSKYAMTATFAGILSAIIGGNYYVAAAIALGTALCVVFALIKHGLSQLDRVLMFCGAQLILIPLFCGGLENSLFALLNTILSVASALLLCMGYEGIEAFVKKRRVDELMLLGVSVIAMLISASCGMAEIAGVRIGAVISGYILLCALISGSEVAIYAIALGAGRMMGGDVMAYSVGICIVAFACMLIKKYGKIVLSIGFVSACIAIGLFIPVTGMMGIVEAVIAAVLFMITPKGIALYLAPQKQASLYAENELMRIKSKLKKSSQAIAEMADAFAEHEAFAAKQLTSVSELMERISESDDYTEMHYRITIGMAGVPKAGMRHSGDSMETLEHGSFTYAMLGDGMGSGDAAQMESHAALYRFMHLIEAGFTPSEAIMMINRMLISQNDGDMYTTLDVMMFNCITGKASFLKLGAPPSFIIRGGKAYTLYSEALPAGILVQAEPSVHDAFLKQGDTIIMMTDGVSEALGSELVATLMEQVCGANTVFDAANAVVQRSIELSGRLDDMSVVVGRIT